MTADDDIAARLQLINTEGIGPVGFKRLLARFGSAEEALRETAAKKKVAGSGGGRHPQRHHHRPQADIQNIF